MPAFQIVLTQSALGATFIDAHPDSRAFVWFWEIEPKDEPME